MTVDPFRVPGIPALLRWPVERALGMTALRRLYHHMRTRGPRDAAERFERQVLNALNIDLNVNESDLTRIPATGPLIVAANHPQGAVDGLVLIDLVRRVRPDVRILANHLLRRIPELDDLCFFVDPFGGPDAVNRSRAGLRAAYRWLRRGGALVMFPAGEVAHNRSNQSIVESPWKTTFERLSRSTGARIVTAVVDGRNSRMFYAAGRVHPIVRTALLGRELLNKRGRRIAVRIEPPNEIEAEVGRLDGRACLVESGPFQVFCTEADRIPETLREIGRLREVTFRAAGEGTGRQIDLDRFDERYLHLFVWDRDRRNVVGAYRIARTDRIVREQGVQGLYTRTLFRYDERLFTRLGAPALELGRSFVRAEYQKNYYALFLLWRGIGAFVAQNPRYRFLFGPVSISARYGDASQAMLVEFLRQNHLDQDLANQVEPIAPPRLAVPKDGGLAKSVDEINRLVGQTEPDSRGMPVLLRQYLKLNARLLGVNVDRNFGDALDALMIVDLMTVGEVILQRYFGKRGAAEFAAFQERLGTRRAA